MSRSNHTYINMYTYIHIRLASTINNLSKVIFCEPRNSATGLRISHASEAKFESNAPLWDVVAIDLTPNKEPELSDAELRAVIDAYGLPFLDAGKERGVDKENS